MPLATLNGPNVGMYLHSSIPMEDDWVELRREVLGGRYGQPDYVLPIPVLKCLDFMRLGGVFSIQDPYISMLNRLRSTYC